jgi:hypothetical protein
MQKTVVVAVDHMHWMSKLKGYRKRTSKLKVRRGPLQLRPAVDPLQPQAVQPPPPPIQAQRCCPHPPPHPPNPSLARAPARRTTRRRSATSATPSASTG